MMHQAPATAVPPGHHDDENVSTALYSVREQFDGATVFLTGATGYVGSLVLESLLRTTDARKVYVLMRGRRGVSAQARLDAVLNGPVFHLMRGRPALLKKVVAVEGDLSEEGMGLSAEDREKLVSECDVSVHCAADIRLEVDVQSTLRANYMGTGRVLDLAQEGHERGVLRALVHVSSAYVNLNAPFGASVAERVYPLRHGQTPLTGDGEGASSGAVQDHASLAHELLALPTAAAEARAETLCSLWRFPNNYTFGKHLAEQMLLQRHSEGRLPLGTVIVRPSLVSAVAFAPYPGYCGNFAGPIGAVAAMATGLYGSLDGIASRPLGVWDMVPGDLVASAVLAAAAAAAAGASGLLARAAEAARMGRHATVADAIKAEVGADDGGGGGVANANAASVGRLAVKAAELDPCRESVIVGAGGGGAAASSVASSVIAAGTNNIANSQSDLSSASQPDSPAALFGALVGAQAHHHERRLLMQQQRQQGQGQQQRHHRLNNNYKSDDREHNPVLIVHACTSSTYPVTLMEAWNNAAEFLAAHPPLFSLNGAKYVLPRMRPAFAPDMARVRRTERRTSAKVSAVCALLRMAGDRRGANKLRAGFGSVAVQNNGRTDRSLTFETHGLVALEAALCPEEHAQRLLVWRPGPVPADTMAASAAFVEAGVAAAEVVVGEGEAPVAAPALSPAALAAAKDAAAVLAAAPLKPISWRRFHHTQMAGVYRTLYGRVVPREADAGKALRERQQQAWWRRILGTAGFPETWLAEAPGAGQCDASGSWHAACAMSHIEHEFVYVTPSADKKKGGKK